LFARGEVPQEKSVSGDSKDIIIFQEGDFISLRAYKLFLNEIRYRDFITHSTPETSKVLDAFAKDMSEEADLELKRIYSLVDDAGDVRARVLECINKTRILHQTFLRVKPNVPRYRRVPIDSLGCELFGLDESDLYVCEAHKVAGVMAQLVEGGNRARKNVEQYHLVLRSMEQNVHRFFSAIVAARKEKIETFGYLPDRLPTGSVRSPFDFRKKYRPDSIPKTLELYRLTSVYASSSSALFNFGQLLNRAEHLLKVMTDRLSTITASSTLSALILALDLVAGLLTPLQLRMDRLQEWSDFMLYKGKYRVDEV
jgi:hypothetical protein